VTLRAVVFDFDGVIANSEPLHYRAFRDVLADGGVPLTERDYYSRYLGFNDFGAFQAIGADRNVEWSAGQIDTFVARKAERMEALERDHSVLFPGAAAAVRRLADRCPLAISSGALRAEILRVLEREGLSDAFAVLVASEDTPVSKPAPDPYRLAVKRLSELVAGLTARDCVAIEDSLWGLESARTAGLVTIAVAHTYPSADLAGLADEVVQNLDVLTFEFVHKIAQKAR
jgi:beta-phosphoglucomutase